MLITRIFRPRLGRLNLDKKLLAVCALSLCIPLTLLGAYFSHSLANQIRDQALRQARISMGRITAYMNEVFNKAVDVSNRLYVNTRLQHAAAVRYRNILEVYEAYMELSSFFGDYLHIYPELAGIRLYVENATMLNNSYFIVADEEIRNSFWYTEAQALGGKILWVYRRDSISRKYVISLVRQIKNTSTGTHTGVLCVNLDIEKLERFSAGEAYRTAIFLDDTPVSPPGEDSALPSSPSSPGDTFEIRASIVPRQSLSNRFELYYSIPKKTLFIPVYSTIRRCLAALFIALILSATWVYLFAVKKLRKEQFFSRQKEIQLKMLSSQINPHFLYNTLETIRMKAVAKDEKDLASAIKMLSRILRRNLNAGENPVSLESEMELVRDYLDIQMIRFGSRISYTIRLEEGLEERYGGCRILPLLIQPLVENSFVHGLETKTEGGHIAINARIEKGELCIEVSDNGQGMSAERLEFVRKTLASSETRIGERIGLANVNQRIKLFYGEPYGVSVVPGSGGGIHARIRIPALEETKKC